MAIFKAIIILLPELIALIKSLSQMIDDGMEQAVIKSQLKAISHAFKNPVPSDRARLLNDIFRGK